MVYIFVTFSTFYVRGKGFACDVYTINIYLSIHVKQRFNKIRQSINTRGMKQ